jgi:hypothetical protein
MTLNETAQVWYRFILDRQFIAVVLWNATPFESRVLGPGYYRGYLGKVTGDSLPIDTYFHMDGAVGGMDTSEIPEIGLSVRVVGFDTNHGHDLNIVPGETTCRQPRSKVFPQLDKIWNRDKVFSRLWEVALSVLNKEENETHSH